MKKSIGAGTLPMPAPVWVVGTYDEAEYENETVDLSSGDRLLFYTDGATDIRLSEEERLGIKGLAELVSETRPEDDKHLRGLIEALWERCIDVEPDDDITLVSCLLV